MPRPRASQAVPAPGGAAIPQAPNGVPHTPPRTVTRRGPDAGDRLPGRRAEPALRPLSEGMVREPCPSCRASNLASMVFGLKSGDTAQMRRCSRCEWKAWYLSGRQVSLAELLTTVQEAGVPRASRQRAG